MKISYLINYVRELGKLNLPKFDDLAIVILFVKVIGD